MQCTILDRINDLGFLKKGEKKGNICRNIMIILFLKMSQYKATYYAGTKDKTNTGPYSYHNSTSLHYRNKTKI